MQLKPTKKRQEGSERENTIVFHYVPLWGRNNPFYFYSWPASPTTKESSEKWKQTSEKWLIFIIRPAFFVFPPHPPLCCQRASLQSRTEKETLQRSRKSMKTSQRQCLFRLHPALAPPCLRLLQCRRKRDKVPSHSSKICALALPAWRLQAATLPWANKRRKMQTSKRPIRAPHCRYLHVHGNRS